MHLVERRGSSEALLCIHGYCQSSAYWIPTLDRLAEAANLHGLAPDLPGFADSAGESGPFTMEDYADRMVDLLDAKGIDQVSLVGGSMGGVVAQHLALRHPSRLRRLLLVATGGATADPAAALAKADQLERAQWDEMTVTPMVAGFFYQRPTAAEFKKYCGIALQASQYAAVAAARSNARSRTLDRLEAIEVPTLIIQGRHDRARTPEHGAEMAMRIRGARLAVIEGSGHTPQLEDSKQFHTIAVPFLLGRA